MPVGNRFAERPAKHLLELLGQLAPDDCRVACGAGALRLLEVQPENRPRMEIRAFLNGYRPQVGERLG